MAGKFQTDDLVALRAEIETAIDANRNGHFALTLSDLEMVNSALISLLLCSLRQAEKVQCQLSLSGVPQKLFDMARVGGVESILPFEK